MATSVPNMFVRWVRMTRGMEEICMKGITICLLITKQTIKSCIITEKVSHCGDTSSGNYGTLWVYCLVVRLYVHWRQKSLITDSCKQCSLQQILCRNKNCICHIAAGYAAKYFLQVSSTESSLLQWWISSCNFILMSLGSLNWDINKDTRHREDTWIIFRKTQKAIWHPALIQVQWLLRSQTPHTSLKVKIRQSRNRSFQKNILSCRYSPI